MSPIDAHPQRPGGAYREGVAAGRWQKDAGQLAALAELDRIHDALVEHENAGVLRRLAARLRKPEPVRGLYLWGEVGRGKTFLVDLFFEHLPVAGKRRVHFHRFMGEVHAGLKRVGERSDPLPLVAAELAEGLDLLCLDEFFVEDIGDAMLLAGLLSALFERGVTLVTTSNTPPSQLYRDGLQRARFLPAIALLERHCSVLRLDSPTDYRLRALTQAPVYYTPLDQASETRMRERYERMSADCACSVDTPLVVNDRPIAVVERADGVVWFAFASLCGGPRSVADYIEIARDFHTVLVSGVPRFERPEQNDAARRFVNLVDELYDRNVNLILSAAAPPPDLYAGGHERIAFGFQRTASRLIEMQSREYLAREHRG